MQRQIQFGLSMQRKLTLETAAVLARRLSVWVALVAASIAGETAILAQQFESLTMAAKYQMTELTGLESKERQKEIKDQNKLAASALKDDSNTVKEALRSGNPATTQVFFDEYLLPSMVSVEDSVLGNLGERRAEFMKDFVSPTPESNRRNFIETIVLPGFKKIAEGNFHPAARLNAVILLGELNDVDTASGRLPTPNEACFKYLLSLSEQADLPEYLRVGAYTGLHRMLEVFGAQNRTGDEMNRSFQNALAIVKKSAPGQSDWSTDVEYWLTRRAIQILGFLKNAGTDSEVINVLAGLVQDPSRDVWLRTDAAQALQSIGVKGKDQALVVADAIIVFAAQSLEEEAQAIREQIEEYVALSLLLNNEFLFDKGMQGGSTKRDTPGLGGASDQDMGAGANLGNKAEEKPKFDLPNYSLNSIRRKVRAYMFYTRTALMDCLEKNTAALDATERRRIENALRTMDAAIKDTDIGLVDLAANSKKNEKAGKNDKADPKPEEKENKSKAIADQLYERFLVHSNSLKGLVKHNAPGGRP